MRDDRRQDRGLDGLAIIPVMPLRRAARGGGQGTTTWKRPSSARTSWSQAMDLDHLAREDVAIEVVKRLDRRC